jgi:hypothetical protein
LDWYRRAVSDSKLLRTVWEPEYGNELEYLRTSVRQAHGIQVIYDYMDWGSRTDEEIAEIIILEHWYALEDRQ